MAKPELGTKRQCRSCGNRFYDLSRDPILCPKCGVVFQLHESSPVAPAAAVAVVDDEVKAEPAAGPELVSLEEADAAVSDKVLNGEEEVEAAEATPADETFLEEEEEGDDDVTALIDGDIEDDEEA
ncbi:MAG: TIGR02300 family protein [Hyphomicrobiales bacterium]